MRRYPTGSGKYSSLALKAIRLRDESLVKGMFIDCVPSNPGLLFKDISKPPGKGWMPPASGRKSWRRGPKGNYEYWTPGIGISRDKGDKFVHRSGRELFTAIHDAHAKKTGELKLLSKISPSKRAVRNVVAARRLKGVLTLSSNAKGHADHEKWDTRNKSLKEFARDAEKAGASEVRIGHHSGWSLVVWSSEAGKKPAKKKSDVAEKPSIKMAKVYMKKHANKKGAGQVVDMMPDSLESLTVSEKFVVRELFDAVTNDPSAPKEAVKQMKMLRRKVGKALGLSDLFKAFLEMRILCG